MDLLRERLRAQGLHRPCVAAAMIGSAVVGGVISSSGAKSAANTEANAANQATQAQEGMFATTVGLEAPYRTAGIDATNKLSYLLGINPSGYSASQSIAPGVSAPATTQYATQAPGAAPSGVSSTPTQPPGGTQLPILPYGTPVPSNLLGTPNDYGGYTGGGGYIVQYPDGHQTMPDGSPVPAKYAAPPQAASAVATPTTGIQNVPGMANPEPVTASVAAPRPDPSTDPAFGSLLHNFGTADFQEDPGIQFQTQQGNLALQNSQAAKDGVLSGSALKDLIGYNQGMAGTGYQSAYDRYMANKSFTLGSLMDVAKQGQAAAGNTVNSAGSFSSGIAGTIQGAGNAQAAGTVGSANALSGAVTGSSNGYLLSNLLNGGTGGMQGSFSQTGIGSSGFGTGLAYGNQDMGQFF